MVQPKQDEPRRVPKFNDEAEAAAFWDTHSPEEFPEDFQEIATRFSRPLIKRGLTVKLSEDTLKKLRQIARERGVGPSTLARMWILEHLQQEKKQTSHA